MELYIFFNRNEFKALESSFYLLSNPIDVLHKDLAVAVEIVLKLIFNKVFLCMIAIG